MLVGCSKQNLSYLAMKSCALQVPTLALPRSICAQPIPQKEAALCLIKQLRLPRSFSFVTASRSLELTHR